MRNTGNISTSQYVSNEHRGRVVNTPALYSGGPVLNLRQETSYPDCDFL
jgi:hypothetical protein